MGLITAKGNRINIWAPEQLHHLSVCPVCLSRKTEEVALRLDGLNICECLACHIGYVNPKPSSEQIRCFYDKDYFTGRKDFFANSDYSQERDKALKSGSVTGYRELVSCVEIKTKVILEIGCGSGSLLCALKPHQPAELIGIDVAKSPIEYGLNQYGLDLRQQALDEADFPSGSFDLVLMIDVIEHIERLSDFIQKVHRILRPGGEVFIVTPNFTSLWWSKGDWISLRKDFDHLHYLSKISLEVLCDRFGFQLKKCWTEGNPLYLKQYPRLYNHGQHRLLFPSVFIINAIQKFRHVIASRKDRYQGHNMVALFRKKVSDDAAGCRR